MTTGFLYYSNKLRWNILYYGFHDHAFEAGIPGTADVQAIISEYWYQAQIFSDYIIGASLCRK